MKVQQKPTALVAGAVLERILNTFPYLPLVEHADFVGHTPYGGETVSNYQGRPPLGNTLERRLHQVLALTIQGAKNTGGVFFFFFVVLFFVSFTRSRTNAPQARTQNKKRGWAKGENRRRRKKNGQWVYRAPRSGVSRHLFTLSLRTPAVYDTRIQLTLTLAI